MNLARHTIIGALGLILVGPFPIVAQSGDCDSHPSYISRNQVDYGPIRLKIIRGKVFIEQNDGTPLDSIPACLALFTEKSHRLVARSEANDNGYFIFRAVRPGRYRLVVRDPQGFFCPANVKVLITKQGPRTRLGVHMRSGGIDSCSFVDTKIPRKQK